MRSLCHQADTLIYHRRSVSVSKAARLCAIVCVFALACGSRHHEEFTPEAWKSRLPAERHVLYKSLQASRLLEGATRERVVELLGPPDFESNGATSHYVSYVVASHRPTLLDWNAVSALDIRFDDRGRVQKYYLRGD